LLIAFTEKKYFKIIEENELNLIFLNSIEISNLKNLNYGQNFEKLMRNFRRGDDYFLDSSYVYDMTEYFHKIEKRKI